MLLSEDGGKTAVKSNELSWAYNLHSDELLNTTIKDKKHYGKIRLITEFPRRFLKYYFLQRYFNI